MGKPIAKRTASKMNAKVFHYTDSAKPSNRLGHSGEPVRHETSRAISFGVNDAGETVTRIVQTGVASGKILRHKTIVVRLTAGGRDGKKQGFVVGKMIAADAAEFGHSVLAGEPTAYLADRDAESGKPYVRDWEVSGTEAAVEWLKEKLENLQVDRMATGDRSRKPVEVSYAMNGRVIRAMGAKLGEKADLQAKESARRKAA